MEINPWSTREIEVKVMKANTDKILGYIGILAVVILALLAGLKLLGVI